MSERARRGRQQVNRSACMAILAGVALAGCSSVGLKTDKVMGVIGATKATIEEKVKLEIARTGANQNDVADALKMDSKIGQKATRIKFF